VIEDEKSESADPQPIESVVPLFHDDRLQALTASEIADPPGPVAGEGACGAAVGSVGTSGRPRGANGGALRRAWGADRPFVLALSGVLAMYLVVNALSVAQVRKGQVASWEPCVWAASSAVAMAVLVPVIALLTHRLRPPRMSRPLAVAAHAVAALVIGLTHVGTMVALRQLAYAAHGWAYTFAFERRRSATNCARTCGPMC